MISHTAASTVKVVAVGFAEYQGDTDDNPIPDPSATSSRVIATPATTAPSLIAHAECEIEISNR